MIPSLIKNHTQAFYEIVYLLTKHRHLTWEMAKREITDRYTGQVLGTIWAILHPLTLMSIYIFIFVFVFKIKIGGTREMPLDYTTYLLSGLIPWLTCQEVMSKASTVITSNANLVKQVVFPIEILPIKTVIASLVTQSIFLVILVTYVIFSHHSLPLTYLILPILILLQSIILLGIAYILSSIGVYLKDVKDIIQVITVIGVYLLPVFYLPDQVPQLFRFLLYLNPFSYLIWCYQDLIYFGSFEHTTSWLIIIIISHINLTLGYLIFSKLKIMFGNVL
jgi:lipopolysaccharide transport system permease protein